MDSHLVCYSLCLFHSFFGNFLSHFTKYGDSSSPHSSRHPHFAFVSFYRKVSKVRASSGVFHADSDPICRRAHDDFLQMLQRPVWTPMEGLTHIIYTHSIHSMFYGHVTDYYLFLFLHI